MYISRTAPITHRKRYNFGRYTVSTAYLFVKNILQHVFIKQDITVHLGHTRHGVKQTR